MCGICGLYSPSGAPPPAVVDAMRARIRHRGPDQGSTDAFGPCVLGHQRLQVLEAVRSVNDAQKRVLVDKIPNRLGQRPEHPTARGGLRPASLNQAASELAGEGVEMSAADTFVHPGLSAEPGLLAPGRGKEHR